MYKIKEKLISLSCSDFRPDNKYISYKLDNNFIKVWSIYDNCEYCCFYCNTVPNVVLFTDNGDLLVIGMKCGTINVWSFTEKRLEFTLNGHSECLRSLEFTKEFLISKSFNSIIFWNFEQKSKEINLNQCTFLEISYDNKYIVKIEEGFFKIRKLYNIFELRTSCTDLMECRPLDLADNGKYVVCGYSKMLKLWSVEDKKEIWSLYAHKLSVRSVAFSYNSKLIASGGDDFLVKIWNLDGYEIKSFKGHLDWVLAVGFSLDGNYVLSISRDGVIKVWDIESKLEKLSYRGFAFIPKTISISKNSKYIAVEYTNSIFAIFYP